MVGISKLSDRVFSFDYSLYIGSVVIIDHIVHIGVSKDA
ncbi:Uncharacterised protein [uncultured archaeon]|nr:Uncharacterised protein [uncultured archaeon]